MKKIAQLNYNLGYTIQFKLFDDMSCSFQDIEILRERFRSIRKDETVTQLLKEILKSLEGL